VTALCLHRMTELYSYDDDNRLTEVTDSSENTKESWTLDGTGNMGDANAANELTASGYVYDRAGNMVADGTKIYEYDAWNRLVVVSADDEGEPGDPLAAYHYDGLNRRIVSVADSNSDGTLDTATHYYYSDQQVIETRSGSLTSDPSSLAPQYQYVWSARYVDSPILRDANADADGLCDDETDDRLYYLTDANSNVTALVEYDSGDTRWEVVERYSYSAYGNVTVYDGGWTSASPAYDNDRLFAGREYDPATGLYYNRDRWYNPTTRTFINRDPEGFSAGDANLYRYVANNPINRTDPTGRWEAQYGTWTYGGSGGTGVWDPGPKDPNWRSMKAAESPGSSPGISLRTDLDPYDRANVLRQLAKAVAYHRQLGYREAERIVESITEQMDPGLFAEIESSGYAESEDVKKWRNHEARNGPERNSPDSPTEEQLNGFHPFIADSQEEVRKFLEAFRKKGKRRHGPAVVNIRAHSHGGKSLQFPKGENVDKDNAKKFAKDLKKAAPTAQLIVLSGCCLGCWGYAPESIVRFVADETGVPVMSPGGFGYLSGSGFKVFQFFTGEDLFHRHTTSEAEGAVNSRDDIVFITYPSKWTEQDIDNWNKKWK
jgi:RHS repeat-associated protein